MDNIDYHVVIRGLSGRSRAVAVMDFLGFDHNEIADKTGVGERRIKQLRDAIRQRIGGDRDDEGARG